MKTTLYIFCILFSVNSVVAQLYVTGTSYVFNKGSMVYAKGELELNGASSNFYLRNEGQFLQGTTSASTNKGIGNLSVFQEGTANNFGYNYWCSPVGVPQAAAGNNDFQLDQVIKRPIDKTTPQTPTFNSGVNGSTTNASLTISNRWIYKYTAANNFSNWVCNSNNELIEIFRNRKYSLLLSLPCPSAILLGIDMEQRLICEVNPKISSLGNSLVVL